MSHPINIQTDKNRRISGTHTNPSSFSNTPTTPEILRAPAQPRQQSSFHSLNTLNVHTLVKNRNGSVLTRKTILKSEHLESSTKQFAFHLQGAPNFRSVDENVYGAAQPTTSGLSSILTLLKCRSKIQVDGSTVLLDDARRCVWMSAREEPMIYINSRPFVLRDEDTPFVNIKRYQGISAIRIEQMEDRLKKDILDEVNKGDGLLLIHDEIETGLITPIWTAIDSVQTQREVFFGLVDRGFNVQYHRIPISPEQAPDDKYIDEYMRIIKSTHENDLLIFNCGMGIGRTTFAMVLAIITRANGVVSPLRRSSLRGKTPRDDLEDADMKNRALLRLVYVLEKGLMGHGVSHSAIDWALARCPIINDLRNAVLGNYQCILQLVSLMQNGPKIKKIVDEAINKCDRLINLREEILRYRVSYSVTGDMEFLAKSLGFLERYSFMIIFCAFVEENVTSGTECSFQEWIKLRPEMSRMLEHMRRKGPRLHLFRPVEDLSTFSSTLNEPHLNHSQNHQNHATELERYVITGRQGTVLAAHSILKLDQWTSSTPSQILGAQNFRKIPGMDIYGTAQPTIEGIQNVLGMLKGKHVVWINLREEPLVYLNGSPYVLRDKRFTLRNIKSYSGIDERRLEGIEVKLKGDVLDEVNEYEGRVLLHLETYEGTVNPIWEDVLPKNARTMRDIMDVCKSDGSSMDYYRVPVTAETAPDEADFDRLLDVVSRHNLTDTAIVLYDLLMYDSFDRNCQIGNGRSTTGTVVTCLVLYWLNRDLAPPPTTSEHTKLTYQVIHSLLRVIKNGLECKRIVDEAIERCSSAINLRTAIEQYRIEAESYTDTQQDSDDPNQAKRAIRKGILNLKRYFLMIAFQSYLAETSPDTFDGLVTFKSWFSGRPELGMMRGELDHGGISSLIPVEQMRPEVLQVVNSRNGNVLAQQTILKHDLFPNCQKMSLPLKIEGAPNYRFVSLQNVGCSLRGIAYKRDCDASVYGIGMSTISAIREVCGIVSANAEKLGRTGSLLLWTSLREEPVLYVNGRPYVLRLFQDPLKNIEATGIARDRVEGMEDQMKKDVVKELKRFNGRILLHDEMAEGNHFIIVPIWETAKEEDILTPLDVYNLISKEGYRVDYLRIPITDEQAPIPEVFDQLVVRLAHLGKANNPTYIDSLFNCQMGRGRTSTGMVVACLMHMIIGNAEATSTAPETACSLEDLSLGSSDFEEHRYRRGEFKIILQLISCLQYGKLAKRFTDTAIDSCSHLQNLRSAIYDYKLQVDGMIERSGKKWEGLMRVGLNYLVRYFYLVCFADYLIEVKSVGTSGVTFCAWLEERQEIRNIVRVSNQSLD